jgi:hypothetical protein
MRSTQARRRANNPNPTTPGSFPAPAAAQGNVVRSAIPPSSPADPTANDPPPLPGPLRAAAAEPGPAAAAASAERPESRDSDDNETPNYLLSPEDINASRRDSDNASRRNSGLADVEGFNKNLVSLFALYFALICLLSCSMIA